MQHVQKAQHVAAVAARLARADVVDDHVPDLVSAVLLAREILGKRGGGDFRNVLVLGDGEHFLFREAAKGQAVLKGNHSPQLKRRTPDRAIDLKAYFVPSSLAADFRAAESAEAEVHFWMKASAAAAASFRLAACALQIAGI